MKLNLEAQQTKPGQIRLVFRYHCKTRKFFSPGVVIPRQDYQKGNLERPVLKSNPKAEYFNSQISLLYHELMQIISTLRREDKLPTADLVQQLYLQTKLKVEPEVQMKSDSFEKLYRRYVEENALTPATEKLYKNVHDQLIECFKVVDLSTFDLTQWTRFRTFLRTHKKHAINTICIRLNKLKALIKYLKANGVEIPMDKFPLPQEEIKKIFLDLKDLQKVHHYQPDDEGMHIVKDLLLFQCYSGLRISDLKRVNRNHHREVKGNHFISMGAYKTNKPIMIPLNSVVFEIWSRHSFALPVITEQHYNRELKKLIRFSGVTTKFEWQTQDIKGNKIYKCKFLYEIFTNHCCSRTAIKYFFSLGYAPDQVARIVGKSLDTIMQYYYEEASEDDIIMRTMEFARQKSGSAYVEE